MAQTVDRTDVARGPSPVAGTARARSSWAPRVRRGLPLVVLFFVPSLVWAFASPVFSVPDEPDHAVKAVSIWYGQLEGSPSPGEPSVVRIYEIPVAWRTERPPPAVCYAFQPEVTPASCDDPLFVGGDELAPVTTYDGGFPPLYYALVGWAGRVSASPAGLYGMRLASAALSAVLIAVAVLALRRVVPFALALAAVLVATTPMTSYLSGSVNPNGFEVAAAIALWCHVVAVVDARRRAPERPVPTALLVGVAATGVALAYTRFLSPAFVGLIVVLSLATASGATLRSLARDRRAAATVGGLAAASIIALGFVRASGSAEGIGDTPYGVAVDPWREVAGMTPRFVAQMIGWFGWLDTPPTDLLVWLWIAATGLLVLLALVLGRPRHLVALALTIAATLAVPIAIQAPRLLDHGLTWQGRHGLPLAVGIPILAAVVLARPLTTATDAERVVDRERTIWRAALLVTVAVVLAHLHAVWWALHRFTLGLTDRGWDLASGAWQPPLGAWTWVAAMGCWSVTVLIVVLRCRPAATGRTPEVATTAVR